MTVEMARVRLIGLKSELLPSLRLLRQTGQVEIDDASESPDLVIRPLQLSREQRQRRQKLERGLAKIEGLAETLGCPVDERTAAEPRSWGEEQSAEIDLLATRIEAMSARADKLDAEAGTLPRYEKTLSKLIPEIPPSAEDEDNQAVGVLINRENLDVLEILRNRVSELTGGFADVVSSRIDEDTRGMLIVFPREFTTGVEELLGDRDLTRFRLPTAFEEIGPEDILETLRDRIAAIPGEQRVLAEEREQLGDEWCARLAEWAAGIRVEVDLYEITDRLGETDRTFVLIGWTRARDVAALQAEFAENFDHRVVVEELAIPEELEKQAPVILDNPAPVRPFERLVHLLASPTYQGLDPSWLMAVFLPILFGMILGDAGYGAVLLVICLLLMRRFKKGTPADLVKILAYGSGWSIVFGVLYGEVFGTLGEELGMHPILFHRGGEEVTSLLVMSVAVGAAHILLGLVIGLWTAVQHRDRNEMLERGGMLVGLVALLFLAGAAAGVLPQGLMTPSIAGVLVGVAILGSSMGWLGLLVGPIEFLSLIGNVLSYLRIAAIGLASVYLAQVANDLGGSLGVLVVGVLIAVLIHALNIALGAFSPTIHSLRLHYVEFFRKFYEGGGRRFTPFSLKNGAQE